MARAVRGLCYDPEGYPYTKILDNPLAKIFGGIPDGSGDFAHASVRDYSEVGSERGGDKLTMFAVPDE
jgi:hypothetical protein